MKENPYEPPKAETRRPAKPFLLLGSSLWAWAVALGIIFALDVLLFFPSYLPQFRPLWR